MGGNRAPQSLAGFMVANFLQNGLQRDDQRRVNDSKDIYKSDMNDIPAWNTGDRAERELPSKIAANEARASANTAITGQSESTTAYRKAQTDQIRANIKNAYTKDEKLNNLDMSTAVKAIDDSFARLEKDVLFQDKTPEEQAEIKTRIERETIARIRGMRETARKGKKKGKDGAALGQMPMLRGNGNGV
jgi:hypothetical protein